MKSRRFKRKVEDKTDRNILDKWIRYYHRNPEYHLSRNKEYYIKRMVGWYEFFKELGFRKCSECGYDKHPKALDFHHVSGEEKLFGISKFINGRQCNDENKKIVLEEIHKCIVLCANCHRIHHFMNPEHTDKD